MRISDWSSDVCSSDLLVEERDVFAVAKLEEKMHERHALAQARHDIGHQRHRQRKAQHVFVEPARLFGITAAIRRGVDALFGRSDERRVGNEFVCTCRSRWCTET